MNRKRKLEKIRMNNYEILCIIRDCSPEQKNNFIERIRESILPENFTTKSEVRKLAYPIGKVTNAEYLLLIFKTECRKITGIEEVLKNPIVIRHMTVNLDTEKKIRIKDSSRLRRNRKPGSRIEKSSQGKLNEEEPNGNENQLKVNN